MTFKNTREDLFKVVLAFMAIWLFYYVSEIITGRLAGPYLILMNLLPFLFFILSAFIFYLLIQDKQGGFSNKVILVSSAILISADNIVKSIIRIFFKEPVTITIVDKWLYFYPVVNTQGSWLSARYGLDYGINIFIVINIVILPLIVQIYRFYVYKKGKSPWIDMAFILMISGAASSLVDKVFFNGSLDFIELYRLFVADFKDFYLTLSIGCLLSFLMLNSKDMKQYKFSFKNDLLLCKEFIIFCCRTFNKKKI